MKGKKTGGRVKGSKNKPGPIDWAKYDMQLKRDGTPGQKLRVFKIIVDDAIEKLNSNPETSFVTWGSKHLTEFWQLVARMEPKEMLSSIQHDMSVNITIEKTYEKPLSIEDIQADEIKSLPMNEENTDDSDHFIEDADNS